MPVKVLERTKILTHRKFSLSVEFTDTEAILDMQLNSSHPDDIYTDYYPDTLALLKKEMPQVLKTHCFNENKYSFEVEVVNTEIGHLFEHLVIQKMTDIYKAKGLNRSFDGLTSWDWTANSYGSFTITINASSNEADTLYKAVEEVYPLFLKILNTRTRNCFDSKRAKSPHF